MFLLLSSYVADLVFGDPEWFPHPVRGMGWLINFLDPRLRWGTTKWVERIGGIVLVFLVLGISTAFAYLFLLLATRINPSLGWVASIYLGYVALSVKDLQVKAKKILQTIEGGSLSEARRQLSKIVGRDTQNLNKEAIVRATIESVAENTNDGIIAPLFYLIIGGPIFALIYKAINTLDSMVGYKNERYLNFGWFAAKLDDLANLIPARISAGLICLTSPLVKGKWAQSFRIMFSDGRKRSSPNSGFSEAAMAGALRIKVGGPAFYQGRRVEKPFLGKDSREIEPSLIKEAILLSLLVSLIMVGLGVLLRWII